MRTLKKSLCLVLAVVMMFSLCAFGASAAETSFTDGSDITYGQAVQVLSELGVITGYEDGSFQPEGTLTRAEACAIIVRLLNMEGVAGDSTFTDTQGHWAEDYIAYCAASGIVAGYGDGTFGPDDTLTGYAWEKMLLTAVGYNAEYEGMTGTTWTIGVAKLAKATELEEDLASTNMSNGVSRDVAAKLAYNAAVNLVIVLFKDNVISVSAGDASVNINNGSYDADYNVDNDNILVIYWKAEITEGEEDDFGRPSTKYFIDELNFELTVAEDPVVVVNSRTKAASMSSLLSGYKIYVREATGWDDEGNATAYDDDATLKYINNSTKYSAGDRLLTGVDSGSSNTVAGSTFTSVKDEDDTLAKALENMTANGKVVEFYANSDNDSLLITDVVVIQYTVGEVTKASTSDSVTTYSVRSINKDTSVTDKTVDADDHNDDTAVVSGTVAKDDIVTYVVANDILYIYPTTTVEGYFSAYTTTNNANAVTVDGTRYSVAMGVKYSSGDTLNTSDCDFFNAVDDDVTLYLDQYGYAVWSDGVGSTDFVFVLDTDDGAGSVLDDYTEVGVVDQEGTASILYSEDPVVANAWYRVSSNGSYKKFNNPDDGESYYNASADVTKLSSSQATLATGIVANGSTNFVLKTKAGTYKVYSGISKLPTYKDIDTTVYAVIKESTGYAVAVYVDVTGYHTSNANEDTIFLLKTAIAGSGYDSTASMTYYTYDAIVDGVKTTISSDTDVLSNTYGLFTYDTDSDGYVTAVYAAEGDEYYSFSFDAGTEIDYSDPVLVVGDETITLDDDAAVYYIHGTARNVDIGDGSILTGTVDTAGKVFVVYNSGSDQTAVEVYFYTLGAIQD